MTTSKNIIRKQILDFQYNGKAEPISLQKEVSEWCRLILIPEIEQHLESFDLGEDYISIDKLEIEASITGTDWQIKLKNNLVSEMESQLNKIKINSDDRVVRSKSLPAKRDELMLFYFQKGYLPWWGKKLIGDDFDAFLLKWLENNKNRLMAEDFNKQLKEIISPEVIDRMVNHIPNRYIFSLLRNLYKKDEALLTSLETFYNESAKNILTNEKQKTILQLIFKWVAVSDERWTNFSDKKNLKKKEKHEHLLYKEIFKQTGLLPKGMSADDYKKELFSQGESLTELLADNSKKKVFSLRDGPDEGFYIENAGAIIIAPFLPALFKKLELINEAEITDPSTADMAIQYAINGKVKEEEYDLVFAKILCGLDVDFVIDANRELNSDQENEVNEMLQSVIEHWSVLKNTSIPGLQETFLKRDGKLTPKEDGWLLQVEQKSYDMLLNQLPWNINMVRLPWMKGIVRTEWM